MAQFQITFRGMGPSEALRAVAEEKFTKLSSRLGRKAGCSIVIDQASGKAHGPRRFSARVQVHAGGGGHVSALAEHESASVAVAQAFERAVAQVTSERQSGQKARPSHHPLVLFR
jgi:ribosome-associated translation inhibitor RaiA